MTQFESKIKEYAKALSDEQMMRDLQNDDFTERHLQNDIYRTHQISWFDDEELPKEYTFLPRFSEHRIYY